MSDVGPISNCVGTSCPLDLWKLISASIRGMVYADNEPDVLLQWIFICLSLLLLPKGNFKLRGFCTGWCLITFCVLIDDRKLHHQGDKCDICLCLMMH